MSPSGRRAVPYSIAAASSALLLGAALLAAAGCGPSVRLMRIQRKLPTGEETASASAEAARQNEDVVLYATSRSADGGDEPPAESEPTPPDDSSESDGTTPPEQSDKQPPAEPSADAEQAPSEDSGDGASKDDVTEETPGEGSHEPPEDGDDE